MSRADRVAVPLNTMCSRRCETPIRSRDSWIDAARTQAPNATDRTPGMRSESTVSPLSRTVRRSPPHRRRPCSLPRPAPAAAAARRTRSLPPDSPPSASPSAGLPSPPSRGHRRSPRRHSPLHAVDGRPVAAITTIAAGGRSPRGRSVSSGIPSGFGTQRLHRQAEAATLVAIDELHLHPLALLDDVLGLLGAACCISEMWRRAFGARHDLDERAERGRALDGALVRLADDRLGRDRLRPSGARAPSPRRRRRRW